MIWPWHYTHSPTPSPLCSKGQCGPTPGPPLERGVGRDWCQDHFLLLWESVARECPPVLWAREILGRGLGLQLRLLPGHWPPYCPIFHDGGISGVGAMSLQIPSWPLSPHSRLQEVSEVLDSSKMRSRSGKPHSSLPRTWDHEFPSIPNTLLSPSWNPSFFLFLPCFPESPLPPFFWTFYSLPQKSCPQDFPGGAVVKNPPAKAGDRGSSPGPGRSHMPRSN